MGFGFRRITPRTGILKWQLLIAAISGLMAVLMLFAELTARQGPDWRILYVLVFGSFSLSSFALSRRGIYRNQVALLVNSGWSGSQVRFDNIESFTWLANLQNLGQHGHRLWIVLKDGQKVTTPVVKGKAFVLVAEVVLTDESAAKLVRDLDAMRLAASRAGA